MDKEKELTKEQEEYERQKQELYASDGADGFDGNLLERNLGLAEALPNIFSLYTAPTTIIVAFSVLVKTKSLAWTIGLEIAFYLFLIILIEIISVVIGYKFSKLGAKELITKTSQKNIFSFTKLFIFLVCVAVVPTVISKKEISIDTLKPIMWIFVLIYFVDLLLNKIIKHLKEDVFYDSNADKKIQKRLEICELLLCLLSVFAYGFAIFPLSLRVYGYQIALYFGIVSIIAVVFTIIDHLINVRQKKIVEDKIPDDIEIYYDVVDKWKIFAYVTFALLHFAILVMAWVCWLD